MGIYGDLKDFALPEILGMLANRGRSGRLCLSTAADTMTFVYERGSVVAVSSGDITLSIGRLLVRLGYVSEEQIEHGLALQALSDGPIRIGDVLVDIGGVTRRRITLAVAAQLKESLFRMLVQPGGSFAFEPHDPPVAAPSPAERFPIEPVILDAIREADEWLIGHQPDELLVLADTEIDTHPIDALTAPERLVLLELLNGSSHLRTLTAAARLTQAEFDATVAGLVQRGLVILVGRASSAPVLA